jgi:hypothetical protein
LRCMKFAYIPFLAFGEKTPSLLFMLHKEKNPSIVKLLYGVDKNFSGKIVIAKSLLRASARFHLSCSCPRFSSCSILLLMRHDV